MYPSHLRTPVIKVVVAKCIPVNVVAVKIEISYRNRKTEKKGDPNGYTMNAA